MIAALAVRQPLTAGREGAGLHQALREATRTSHEQLHRHAGFAAVKNGSIEPAAYQALLARLLGFHLPFEKAAAIGADRSSWLRADLAVLGAAPNTIAAFRYVVFFPAW